MAASVDRSYAVGLHPAHAVFLASTVPLFLGAFLSDWAFSTTYENQWINFASWLNAGGMVFASVALLWALIDLFRSDGGRNRRTALYFLVLLTTWVLGFIAALVHGKDAWATMPSGLILSLIVLVLAVAATFIGFSHLRTGDER